MSPDPHYILVCGGRDFADVKLMHAVLSRLNWDGPGQVTLLHGAARGADTLASTWGNAHGGRVPVKAMPADWVRFGRRAGSTRNQQMLDEHPGRILLVVAFPGGAGTTDMVRRALDAGVPVLRGEP